MSKRIDLGQIDPRLGKVIFIGLALPVSFHAFFEEILNLLRESMNSMGPPSFKEPGQAQAYMRLTHSGWKLAQGLIVNRLLELLEKRKQSDIEIQKAHATKDYELKRKREVANADINDEMLILRRCIDHIAWMIIGADHSVARRLPVRGGEHNFSEAAIYSAMPTIDEMNEDPDRVAIACDLTTFVQICDVLSFNAATGAREFIELKAGEKNYYFANIAKETFEREAARTAFEATLGSTDLKHFQRTTRQFQRAQNVQKNIKDGSGLDNFSGRQLKISETPDIPVFFTNEIMSGYHDIKSGKTFSIAHVDDCLFVGMYDNAANGLVAFSGWLKLMGCDREIVNITDSIFNVLTRPFTTLDLAGETIKDILAGRFFVFMCLDVGALIRSANEKFGEVLKLAEQADTKSKYNGVDYVQVNGCPLLVKTAEQELCVGIGSTDRVFFDLQRPLNVIQMLLSGKVTQPANAP